ncbi:hypothetical protein [Pedobacter jamesrossensis]|uniref:Uncharacterized protein n=1 Tax=Pedobacter jamesrossensis TaxID=1908238 RepID=A0ABV8NK15_9SPHI
MEKYSKIADDTILFFEQKHPSYSEYLELSIPKIKQETLEDIERFREDIEIMGKNEIIFFLKGRINTAKESYQEKRDYLKPYSYSSNDNETVKIFLALYTSFLLTAMLEIKLFTALIEELKTNQTKPKVKTIFKSLSDAAKDYDHLIFMQNTLIAKKIINPDNTMTKSQTATASLLYGYIKRFKRLGYFKKITDIELHKLVNEAFNMDEVNQTFKQAPVYNKEIDYNIIPTIPK